jgi:glycosyltransferase involved in cell wall biosynthesis
VCSRIFKIGIVTIYPPPLLIHGRNGGVASYSKNLVLSLLNYCSVVVFAEKLLNSKNNYRDGVPIYRCWTKGVSYPFQIFRSILKNKVDLVHIQYETYLFGGMASALTFPLLVALIRLLRKPIVVTMHGVLSLSKMNKSLVKLVVLLSTKIIVHEKTLMNILTDEYRCDHLKINVINHGIEQPEVIINSDKAKKKLSIQSKKVILFFGYLTGYKNLDLLIDSARFLKTDDWLILIAGGMHPRLTKDSNYINYISELREKAARISEKSILFKGFVNEEEISLYFSAADLVIFPYNICISSSGPLSLAASFGKPFLVSDAFREVINFDDVRFKDEPKELAAKIDRFFDNPELKLKVIAWVEKFRVGRSWDKVAEKTFALYTDLIKT